MKLKWHLYEFKYTDLNLKCRKYAYSGGETPEEAELTLIEERDFTSKNKVALQRRLS